MQKGKGVVWGGLTNSWGKKTSERHGSKGKIYPTENRVPETRRRDKKAFLSEQCKEIEENNRMGKTFSFYRSFLENWRYQGNITCKDGHDKGQKWEGPNRSKGY